MLSYEIFENLCYAQDASIQDPQIERSGRHNWPLGGGGGRTCFTPSGMLGAIAAAGNKMRQDPDARLVSKPVEIPDEYIHDIGMRTLGGIVNASIYKLPDINDGKSFISPEAADMHTCASAEIIWTQTLLPCTSGEKPLAHDIITDAGCPVMLRKQTDIPSALSLEDIRINGIPYPAGSLLSLKLSAEQGLTIDDRNFAKLQRVREQSVQRQPRENVAEIGFLRLSAFALDSIDRWPFLQKYYKMQTGTEEERAFVADATLDNIRSLAVAMS